MTDMNIRTLQRQAEAGDPEAALRLAHELRRSLDVIGLVTRMSGALQAAMAKAIVAEDVHDEIVSDVLRDIEIDASDVAYHIDASDVAGEMDPSDVADYIEVDLSDIAGEIAADDVAEYISASDVADYVNLDDLAQQLVDDHDDLVERIAILVAAKIDLDDLAEKIAENME